MMKTPIVAAFALAILFGAPALVQPANAAPPTDDARMKALRECSVRASKYIEHTWGDVEIYTYRACMAERGQQE
jgi:hypothetical protein